MLGNLYLRQHEVSMSLLSASLFLRATCTSLRIASLIHSFLPYSSAILAFFIFEGKVICQRQCLLRNLKKLFIVKAMVMNKSQSNKAFNFLKSILSCTFKKSCHLLPLQLKEYISKPIISTIIMHNKKPRGALSE